MRKFLSAAAAALLLTSLAGCIDPGPVKTPVPTPSATPVFASDEEALAAAEAAYAAYLAVLDKAFETFDPAGLREVASGKALSEALESVEGFQRENRRITGQSSSDSATLIQAQPDGYVEIYACLDVSKTDVLDESGTSTLSPDRPTRFPMQVALDWASDRAVLIVSEAEVWGGENFCG